MRVRLGIATVAVVLLPAAARTAAPPHRVAVASTTSAAAGAWESAWTATHEDLVPAWVRAAAARVTIAVVDTGADLTVPALAGKAVQTWDVASGTAGAADTLGHGTFVASIACGSAATVGFGGAARLMVVRASRGGVDFADADEAAAIRWAVDHGANIVNLSIGGTTTSQTERDAVAYAIAKGVLLVAAAGNSGEDGNPITYPAALVGRAGLVVGAADDGGRRAAFSSTGPYVDLLAPGVDVPGAIAPTAPPTAFHPARLAGVAGRYGVGTGTSFAAPEVAGAAALVMAANPRLGAAAVARLLEQTASGNGRWTPDLAYGNLDVAAAVQAALAER